MRRLAIIASALWLAVAPAWALGPLPINAVPAPSGGFAPPYFGYTGAAVVEALIVWNTPDGGTTLGGTFSSAPAVGDCLIADSYSVPYNGVANLGVGSGWTELEETASAGGGGNYYSAETIAYFLVASGSATTFTPCQNSPITCYGGSIIDIRGLTHCGPPSVAAYGATLYAAGYTSAATGGSIFVNQTIALGTGAFCSTSIASATSVALSGLTGGAVNVGGSHGLQTCAVAAAYGTAGIGPGSAAVSMTGSGSGTTLVPGVSLLVIGQ